MLLHAMDLIKVGKGEASRRDWSRGIQVIRFFRTGFVFQQGGEAAAVREPLSQEVGVHGVAVALLRAAALPLLPPAVAASGRPAVSAAPPLATRLLALGGRSCVPPYLAGPDGGGNNAGAWQANTAGKECGGWATTKSGGELRVSWCKSLGFNTIVHFIVT